MPPKPQAKKGKEDELDFSDVPTLPTLNSINFTILYHKFKDTLVREKIQKYVAEHLSAERVKTLNREEIITYGKAKYFILEPQVIATLPPDDPRLKLTEADQLAKAFSEKLFELQVYARRAKKEKITKIEEEQKIQQQTDPNIQINPFAVLDQDQLDIMFQFIDFPLTEAEAHAFAKLNQTLHCVMEVNQTKLLPEDPDEFQITAERVQAYESELQYDQENQNKVHTRISHLLEGRKKSEKTSYLRNLMISPIEYVDFSKVTVEVNDRGEEEEKQIDPQDKFSQDMNKMLERSGAMFIKYQKFKDKVKLLPLAPDLHSIQKIEQFKQEQREYAAYVEECNGLIAMTQQQKDQLNKEQLDEIEERIQEFNSLKGDREAEEEDRKKQLEQLQSRLKVSVDDEKKEEDYPIEEYKKKFINHNDSKNHVASIMSAMVQQLSGEVNQSIATEMSHYMDANDQPTDAIDDLFDDFLISSKYDMHIEERPQEVANPLRPASSRLRKPGSEALSQQITQMGEVEYNEEMDISSKSLNKLPKEVTNKEQDIAEDIRIREKKIVSNLVLPGANRHLMPQIPSKSQRLRDAEKPALYPFMTLPIEDAERSLIMKAFQELMRSGFIDEGKSNEDKHNKYKAFERNFQSHMNTSILRQVLAEALLQDPDVATLYYPRDDSLLLALYNKVKIDKKEGDVDGEKQWRAAYRVLPDFENFVKFFADEICAIVPSKDPVQLPKYNLDEEMIPETLLDIDDQKIQNVSESSQMFYPEDNSVMRVDSFSVGGETYKKSAIYKDNLTFGLRPAQQSHEIIPEDEKEYGLVTYKAVGDTELWVHLDNYTKMQVECVQRQRNPQKLIRVDPPKPTPEELAERAEQIKAQQAQIAKNKGKIPAGMVIIEEYKEPEPTWVQEALNELDCLFDDGQLNSQTYLCTTSTFTNGLIIRHYQNGEISQTTQDQEIDKKSDEIDRVFLPNGIVIRHLRNRDSEVLYPSGVKAYFDRKQMLWIVTNNKGLRTAKKEGIQWDIDPIPCAFETDAVSDAKMMVREDNVISVRFKDGSLYCQHSDGTMIWTNGENNQIRIEKEGYATALVTKFADYRDKTDQSKAENRAYDNAVIETLLPDGTVTESVLEDYQSNSYTHFFKRPDFTVISVGASGAIDIISSNARSSLNECYGRRMIGNDIDYLKAITTQPESPYYITRGTYHAFITKNAKQSYIATLNLQGNKQFVLNADLELLFRENVCNDSSKKLDLLKNYQNLNDPLDEYKHEDGREVEDVYGPKNPFLKNFNTPRLFVIKNDGSGYEMLSKEQLEYYFRVMKTREESLKQRKFANYGTAFAKTHYFVTKVKNAADKEQEFSKLKSLNFPQNAQYALLKNIPKKPRADQPLHAFPDQFLFRQIFEFQEFEPFKQEAFYDDFLRFKQWKMSQVRYESEFGITWVSTKDTIVDQKKVEEEEYFSKRIINKILKERRINRKPFDPEEYKQRFIAEMATDEELNQYYKRVFLGGGDDLKRSLQENAEHQREKSQQKYDKTQDETWRQKKKSNAQQKVKQIISEIHRMINTPTFLPNYFKCRDGQTFTKNNPEKAPTQELMMRMSQRIHRSQQNSEKAQSQFDAQSHKSAAVEGGAPQNQDNMDDKDNPIVALEPEDHMKQGSAFMGSKKRTTMTENPLANASLYLQEKVYMKQREQEHLLKAEEYHVVKTKDFNVVGRLRQEKPVVKAIQKSQAQPDLNEKFITTECIADRRVKISSMAARQYANAPSVEDVRKQGQHQMILSAINKKQTFAELINQANSMVTGVLHDPLKRSVNIMPSKCVFGHIKKGQHYEMVLTIKNEDSIAQRIVIAPIADPKISVEAVNTGAIAPGMMMKVIISIVGQEDFEGQIRDALKISTKTDVFKIPIEANVLNAENFEAAEREAMALQGKGVSNPRVREKMEAIKKGRWWNEQDAFEEQPSQERVESAPPKQWQEKVDNAKKGRWWRDPSAFREGMIPGAGEGKNWIETTQSDSKLPQIPNIDKRPFEVDPKKNLKEILKK